MINLNKIKEKFNKLLDVILYKKQIKYLQKKVKELEEERKPLIDLKNKYLSDLRCKNLEIGRIKKKVEELKETIFNLYGKLEDKNIACNWKDSCLENTGKVEKLENQQKEFINYINSYIKLLKDKPDLVEEGQKDILEEILSKYQKIIGGKENE